MNFWQQLLLIQASSAIHALVRTYGAKYLTPNELDAADVLADAIIDLPQRIHAATPVPLSAATHVTTVAKKK